MGSVLIIGGGLAGCEAAWQASRLGTDVVLYEMRPLKTTPAHHTGLLAEWSVILYGQLPFQCRWTPQRRDEDGRFIDHAVCGKECCACWGAWLLIEPVSLSGDKSISENPLNWCGRKL